MGFVENGSSDYTHQERTAEKLMAAVIKSASTDSTAAVLFGKIKGEKFIQYTSKQIYQAKVIGEGISIKQQTTTTD